MNDISKILKEAKKALELIGIKEKSYPSFYLVERFQTAVNASPRDQFIGNMKDVIVKQASTKDIFTEKEVGEIYEQMVGLAGGRTEAFRGLLGDLLPEGHGRAKTAAKGYDKYRKNEEVALEPIFGDTELSKALSTVFSLDKQASFGYKQGLDKKAENYAKLHLNSLGCPPQSVKAIHGNDHYILCLASYDMSNFQRVDVKIPVQVSHGSPEMPTHMVQDSGLVELTKSNLLVHIKDESNHRTDSIKNVFASSRDNGADTIKVDKPVMPASLAPFANLDNELIAAASKFSKEEVKLASNVVSSGLTAFGVKHSQVKIASTTDSVIVMKAEVPTKSGLSSIYVPVEFHNGMVTMPSRFASDGSEQVFDFSPKGISEFIMTDDKPVVKGETVSRQQPGELNNMSYHELMDNVLGGIQSNDYKMATDALSNIQERFDGAQYQNALDKFSSMLKHVSNGSARKKLIAQAIDRKELIYLPTSVEPFCPKLGLPISKVDFDSKGRMIPLHRRAQENAIESDGTYIQTSKIILT